MKLNFVLGTFSIAVLLSACGAQVGTQQGSSHDDGAADDGSSDAGVPKSDGESDVGTSQTDGDGDAGAGTSKDAGDEDAGTPSGDGTSDAGASKGGGPSITSGSVSGGASGGSTTKRAGAGATGGTDDGVAEGDAGAATDDDSGDGDAAGSDDDGDGQQSSGGTSNSGGFAGAMTGGTGGAANSGGSAGLSNSGGLGGASNSGGFAGLAGSGGTGDVSSSSGGSAGQSNDGSSGGSAGASGGDSSLDPQYLFTEATFGGNGRTCVTCHSAATGTISPDDVQALYASNPGDPLFSSIDSDDGAGDDYTQLQAHATFRVTIPLPPGVTLASDPTATSVVLRRGAPSTINTPSLDSVLMWDGREPDLESQAQDAILGHSQGTITPTTTQLQLIAQFEQGPDFFSSDLLRDYAQGGTAPTWPPGGTDEEQRGRRWFAQDSAAPRFNVCGQCHGGPMANTTQSNSGLPVGKRFQTVNVSEFNVLDNPTYTFVFPDPNNPGKTVSVTTPDPGRALVTGDVRDVNFFKIPSLWGVKNTAPYFHDNSVNTLEDLMNHYEQHLATFLPATGSYPTPHVPTTQDKADIVAYLKLL